jgi:hypothetical protein
MTGSQEERMPRRRVMWAIYTGRPLDGVERDQGIAEARAAADKLGDGLVGGLLSAGFIAVGASAVASDGPWIGLAGAAVVIYLGGLSYAVRAWVWLRRRGR